MFFSKYFYLLFFCTISCAPIYSSPIFDEANPLTFPKEDFQHEDEKLKFGDELYEAALYSKAIDSYKKLLENNSSIDKEMQIRFRLAQAYFSLGEYQEAISQLSKNLNSNNLTSEKLRRHSLYLMAISYENLDEYQKAKKALLDYVESKIPPSLPFHDEAIFQIGHIEFLNGNYEKAYKAFDSLKNDQISSRLYILSRLYISRIFQLQGNYVAAAKNLEHLDSKLVEEDPLHFELNYLQGEAAFELHDYPDAIAYFKKALPANFPEKINWYSDTLYHLGWSYLRLGDNYLKKAEETFQLLLKTDPNEKGCLALAQCYLSQAKYLKQLAYYSKAEELLSKSENFKSKEAKAHALLLRAEAASTYSMRDLFYRQITEEPTDPGIYYAKGWYMRSLNEFENGHELVKMQNFSAAKNSFERSSMAFRKSYELLQEKEPAQAGAALKYQALAESYSNETDGNLKAMQIIEELMGSPIWKNLENKAEIFYLHGYFAGRLSEKTESEKYLEISKKSFQAAVAISDCTFGDIALSHLGALYFKNKDFKKAEEIYLQLISTYPNSDLIAEACLWSAYCADHLQADAEVGKTRRRQAFENFPNSPYAAEAYFSFYTYPEYLQGDRATIKHLQSFIDLYSETPFLIDAHFLIALDNKRDRKTPQGRWIRKKSLTEAIDSFQRAEMLFDELLEKKLIPEDKVDYYTAMRYRATLERAMINLAIADESQGAKQQIYLDYAEEVFKNLSKDLLKQKNSYLQHLFKENVYPLIEEESSFWLAQTYLKAKKDDEANLIYSNMIDRYQKAKITKSYYLSRTLDELGKIALRQKEYAQALQLFKNAEEASKGNLLSTDQKLELWIQQSLCYRGMNLFDEAILILSKVINDDAISSLRLKAMYLRAETYELQKRPELARKQLESMVKKGGIWARKAQEKLDKDDL